MTVLHIDVPPFPVFVKMGEATLPVGKKHFKRTFSVFDLIYVVEGKMFLSEDNSNFEIGKGEYICLLPGLEHFGYKGCEVETKYFWIHFRIQEEFLIKKRKEINWGNILVSEGDFVTPSKYVFQIPRFGKVNQSNYIESIFENMLNVGVTNTPDFPLRQQIYFEELLLQLQKDVMTIPTATENVTEKTLNYIQRNYKEDIKMDDIARELHFHSDYITRCMQKTIGMSPIHYLNKYRIAQAKRLLTNTNDKVMTISKSIGIQDHTYFSKLFKKVEGVSPSEYRQFSQRES
ncbi:AraC family transcriptional regulator [Litchfieldia salsa]|uniref:AraC-type DNA-binding protein n=1 Tax=Litchfieldia salsa TaxID=930152 RepID=A0A1H0ULE9_9BACI|nr:AraC family transcriptional regulator [Litchfieldia salsa]SDP67162.1 AraC-type DNA-binding protein [Litchfieldia salsa]